MLGSEGSRGTSWWMARVWPDGWGMAPAVGGRVWHVGKILTLKPYLSQIVNLVNVGIHFD